jgi:hypothetical protein
LPPASLATAGPTTAAAIPTVHAPCEDGQAWQEALGTLPATAVQHVEPTYLRDTCAGTTLVSGTKLAVVPDAVQSAQWARLLECRTARVRFAKVPASVERASRPWTPEGWVDIAVEHDPKSLILTLHAESAAKNIQLFHTTLASWARREIESARQDSAYRLRDGPELRGAPVEPQSREAQALGGRLDPRAPKRFAAGGSATRLHRAGDRPHLARRSRPREETPPLVE